MATSNGRYLKIRNWRLPEHRVADPVIRFLRCIALCASLLTTTVRGQGFLVHSGEAPTPPITGYVLKFDDEFVSFNGNASGRNGWQTQYPWGNTDDSPDIDGRSNAGNAEEECYNDSSIGPNPYKIANGALQISATKASVTGRNFCKLPYNSGLIQSLTTFYMQYGYFEMRAMLPHGQGLWPAFWLAAANITRPREIDVMENLAHDSMVVYQNIHYGSTGKPRESGPAAVVITDASANWHVYAVDWEPSEISFYVDGVLKNHYPTPAGLNTPMYMLINLGVGGRWAGSPNTSTSFPAIMAIDWVRAWASPNSIKIGRSAPPTWMN